MIDADHLDALIEAIADGTHTPDLAERAHLDACPACRAELALARDIDSALMRREVPVVPAAFTARVMARIGSEEWRTERAIDFGFNLALAAGLLIIGGSGLGLAWSLGLFTVTIDPEMFGFAARTIAETSGLAAHGQTAGVAAAVLVMALGLWWWAEMDSAM